MGLRRSYTFIFVALSLLDFAKSDIRYILPSTEAATCPSTSASNCFVLAHIAENDFTLISGLNTTLLFLPGTHTLTSTLTVKNLSSFTMITNKHLPRPVINCEQQAIFRLISITYVKNWWLKDQWMLNKHIYDWWIQTKGQYNAG